MWKEDYDNWLNELGYTDINDWNFQTIGRCNYFFIKHTTEDKYALIRYTPKLTRGPWIPEQYEVLVHGWTDYNGWGKS